jgi:hypothetical protein
MADYIVESAGRDGGNWSRYSRDSNESQAIRSAENLQRSRNDLRVRVVDENGNVRYSG